MNIKQIENILAKVATGEADSGELALIEVWRSQSDENQELFNEYQDLWEMTSSYKATFVPDMEGALASHLQMIAAEEAVVNDEQVTTIEKSSAQVRRLPVYRYASIAAVFIVALAAVFLLDAGEDVYSADDSVSFVSLSDGSSVWLDKGSVLSVSDDFGTDTRDVKLSGKAFFDIARNEAMPFTIAENDLTVSVLGTSFTVDGKNNRVDVSTGRVAVAQNDQSVIIEKNQSVEIIDNQLNIVESAENHALWRNPALAFDSAPLQQVIADINLHFGDRVQLSASEVVDCPFTSSGLAQEGLDNTIKILKAVYDMNVVESQGVYILTISDCL